MNRKGLGKGLGTGYKNLIPIDKHVHSLSAKGVKSVVVFPVSMYVDGHNPDKRYLIKKYPAKEKGVYELKVGKKVNLKLKSSDKKTLNATGSEKAEAEAIASDLKKQGKWESFKANAKSKIDSLVKAGYSKEQAVAKYVNEHPKLKNVAWGTSAVLLTLALGEGFLLGLGAGAIYGIYSGWFNAKGTKYTKADYKKVAKRVQEGWSDYPLMPPSEREIISDLKKHPKKMKEEMEFIEDMER